MKIFGWLKRPKAKALGYDAAGTGRRLHSWVPTTDSANAILFQDAALLRSRSRDMARKNAYAANGIEAIVANAVGTGIKPQSKTDEPGLRQQIQALWLEWTDEADSAGLTDFYGLQALICRAMVEGGECFVRLRVRRPEDGLSVPLQLQTLEAEHLDASNNKPLANGNFIRGGIEFNRLGQRVAYHLYREHPGDVMLFGTAMTAEIRAGEKAVTAGVKQATDSLKLAMRRQVTSAGLGQRLANTWRGKVYPQGQVSLKAAGLVYTNAPEIMTGLEVATTIRGKDGLWLAIPTPNAPKRGVGGKRITPTNFPEQSLGRLRFVYRRSGVSLLVVDNVRASFAKKTGALRGFKQASDKQKASGRGLSTAVMFWLVPMVKTRKRIDLKREAEAWQNRLPSLIANNWKDPK